jgi:hypothetical protein
MKTSTELNEIATALVGFHKAMGKVKKEAANPFFKSKYASLPNILDAIREPLILNNLSVVQFPTGENELTTILMHTSGQFMQSSYLMRPVKNDPQGVGSCITYQRRYAVGAILSLSIDEDDDGNAASTPAKQQVKQPENRKYVLDPGSPKWKDAVTALMAGNVTIPQIKAKYELSTLHEAELINQAAQTV